MCHCHCHVLVHQYVFVPAQREVGLPIAREISLATWSHGFAASPPRKQPTNINAIIASGRGTIIIKTWAMHAVATLSTWTCLIRLRCWFAHTKSHQPHRNSGRVSSHKRRSTTSRNLHCDRPTKVHNTHRSYISVLLAQHQSHLEERCSAFDS